MPVVLFTMSKGSTSGSLPYEPFESPSKSQQQSRLTHYDDDRQLIFSRNNVLVRQGTVCLRGYLSMHSRQGCGVTLSWIPISVLRGLHDNNPDIDKQILVQIHNVTSVVVRSYSDVMPSTKSETYENVDTEVVLFGVDGTQYPGFRFTNGGAGGFMDALNHEICVEDKGKVHVAKGAWDHTYHLGGERRRGKRPLKRHPHGGHDASTSGGGTPARSIFGRVFGGRHRSDSTSSQASGRSLTSSGGIDGAEMSLLHHSGASSAEASPTRTPQDSRTDSPVDTPSAPLTLEDKIHAMQRKKVQMCMRNVLVAWRLQVYRTHKRRKDVSRLFRVNQHGRDFEDDEGYITPAMSVAATDDEKECAVASLRVRGLTQERWRELCASQTGHVCSPTHFYRAVACGGADPALRAVTWKLLLQHYGFKQTSEERCRRDIQVEMSYEALNREYKLGALANESTTNLYGDTFLDHCKAIDQDVARSDFNEDDTSGEYCRKLRSILRTYVFHNPDLGYVQGMLDLLEPILLVVDNEACAHSCFCNLLKRSRPRFDRHATERGMEDFLSKLRGLLAYVEPELSDHFKRLDADHFFFSYRWFLLDFKREFQKQDVFVVWESIWAMETLYSRYFTVFVALTLLQSHREDLMACSSAVELMRVFNTLGADGRVGAPLLVIRSATQLLHRVHRELVDKNILARHS
eukprot:m.279770 g.279770  ORF g.279770 m.279770 type:complete len:689 (+) comp19813_c0_seq3:155-2221(+)